MKRQPTIRDYFTKEQRPAPKPRSVPSPATPRAGHIVIRQKPGRKPLPPTVKDYFAAKETAASIGGTP